jgi:hypothetical protein
MPRKQTNPRRIIYNMWAYECWMENSVKLREEVEPGKQFGHQTAGLQALQTGLTAAGACDACLSREGAWPHPVHNQGQAHNSGILRQATRRWPMRCCGSGAVRGGAEAPDRNVHDNVLALNMHRLPLRTSPGPEWASRQARRAWSIAEAVPESW